MRPRRWTVRVRLTMLYGGLVLVAGAAVLAGLLIMLDRVIATQPIVLDSAYVERLTAASTFPGANKDADQRRAKVEVLKATEDLRADLRSRTLTPLIGPSLVGLSILGVAGLGVGWFVAGRALRPIQQITATAQAVASGRLDTRIAMDGPKDELRKLADTFDAMLDRLHEASASQRAFIGNASHELKTPVAINRTLVDVALTDPDASPDLIRLGHSLQEVNMRQQRLIDGLLALAQAGNMLTKHQEANLDDIARTTIDRYQGEAEQRRILVKSSLHPAPLTGDPVLLERLVENLIQNAVVHNTNGGGWITVRTCQSGDAVQLQVANSGPVVPTASIANLFEPFRRPTDRVDSAAGSGLGLSIVRTVAEAHGGTVEAMALRRGGLSVEVVLPGSERTTN